MPKQEEQQPKNTLVPALRFPEFQDAGEWEEKTLGEVSSLTKGKGLPKSEIVFDGKNLCIHYGELFTQYSEVISNVKSRTNCNDGVVSKKNDVLMPTSDVTPNGLAKASCIRVDNVLIGGDILIIRPDSNIINGEFLSRIIRFNEREVLKLVSGTTVYHFYASALEKFRIIFPSLSEQQKIADCLSSLDEWITAEGEKLEALKAHKKGLMQQLFPAQGETVPRLRFPEFQDAEEWEEKTLGEVAEINPKVPQLPNQFIYIDLESVENGILKQKKVTNIEEAPSRAQRLLQDKDVIFQMVRPYQRNNYYFNDNEDDYRFVASTGYAQLRTSESSMFLFQLLHTDSFVNKVLEKCSGSNYPAINSSDLAQISVSMPPTLPEQQKIADCLSSLDELITAQAEQVTLLKRHKKGLMQRLFP